METRAVEAVETLVAQYPQWQTPEGAHDQCRIASERLVEDLRDAGIGAVILWVAEPRQPSPSGSLPLAQEHLLVLIDGESVVDLTRRQCEPDAEHPRVYRSLADVGQDWGAYWAPGDDRDGTRFEFG